MAKSKVLGWVGYVDDKPYWEKTTIDSYVGGGEPSIRTLEVFKSKVEARKQFEDVRPVRML